MCAPDAVFTMYEIQDLVRKKHPGVEIRNASLRSGLWAIKNSGKLIAVERGGGKKPAKYRRAPLVLTGGNGR